MHVFVPGNTPSSKNSNQIGKRGGLFKSKTVRVYLQNLGVAKYSSSKKLYENYKTRPNIIEQLRPEFQKLLNGKEYPIKIGFYFVRKTKARFDYQNICQIILDLMTAHNWIPDDSMDYVIPVFMGYHVNKENPGVFISVL